MRFLCLHGAGTNSEIFELQTAPLRYELGGGHTYEFLEGSHPCEAAAGVDAISSPGDGFYAYFDRQSLESARQALEDLDVYVSRQGPFDGVMAFSDGARAAATLLIRKTQQDPRQARKQPIFKCAIFFCGGTPGDPTALLRDEVRIMDNAIDGEIIGIPTAHVRGLKDVTEPNIGIALTELCNAKLRSVYVHSGGHEIPGPKDREALLGAVRCIQKTIDRALASQ